MKSTVSATITLWANRIIAAAMAVLCFTMYELLTWYSGVRNLPWQICAVIMIAFYLCVPAVLFAQVGADHGAAFVDVAVQGLQDLLALPEPDRVDVVQGDLALAQRRGTHDVAQHIPGER